MILTLEKELEDALKKAARDRDVAPEVLARAALRERFLDDALLLQPPDEWGKGLLAAARKCGVSLPDSAFSGEGLYD